MRIGQNSAIHFASQITTSLLGFLATLYVARALGSQGNDVLGVYFVVVAVVIWLRVISGGGIQTAVKKRVSEGVDQAEYITAGIVLQIGTVLAFAILLYLASPLVTEYLRGVPVEALLALLVAALGFHFVTNTLDGLDLVHVSSLLSPLNRLFRSAIQIGLVFLGFALTGLLVGYVTGAIVASLVGAFFVGPGFTIPRREHFRELVSYARFSWLTSLSSRSFASLDTLVLGVFVTDGLIGIYEVSWNLASILAVFGTSISRAVFPAISSLSSEDRYAEAASLVTDSLRFTGLFLIPGLVGGILLGGKVLLVYGAEFTQGKVVLVILIVAQLANSYQQQFITALNAIDRPDLAFRIDGVFIVTNLLLNVVLVYLYGWHGAAVATTVSAVIALYLGYRSLSGLVDLEIPLGEIGRQIFAALVMASMIGGGMLFLPGGLPTSLGLVFSGAFVYCLALFIVSPLFRSTIYDNVPWFA